MTWQRTPRTRKDVPAAEYWENDTKQLQRLIDYMTVVANQADNVRELATVQLRLLQSGQGD